MVRFDRQYATTHGIRSSTASGPRTAEATAGQRLRHHHPHTTRITTRMPYRRHQSAERAGSEARERIIQDGSDIVTTPDTVRSSSNKIDHGPPPGTAAASRGLADPDTLPVRIVLGLRAYCLIAAMWIRSTLTYRASFAMTAFGTFAGSALDFAAILLMFSRVDALGGYTLPEVAFLYGTAGTAFGIADMVMGQTGGLGRRVRDGTLDTFLVRPVPVLAQLAADRFALRRTGRILQGVLVLGYGLWTCDVDWTPLRVLAVPSMLLSGAAIFSAVLLAGGAFQFVAQDAAEVQNSFTYGGNTVLQYPPTIFARDLVRGVTFIVPLAFVNWLPGLYVLGRPYPLALPRWLAWTPPLVATACCALASAAWRAGLRSYRSTGS